MSEPPHAFLLKDGVHSWNPGPLKHIGVEHLFLPLDVQYASESPQVKSVQLVFLSGEQGPGLAAVQECAQDASPIDLDLGVFRKIAVAPQFLGQL